MTHGVYLVSGTREYRGHKPGTKFEARLDPLAERRAIARGDIVVLERITPTLREGDYELPKDWPPAADTTANREAPQGASLT